MRLYLATTTFDKVWVCVFVCVKGNFIDEQTKHCRDKSVSGLVSFVFLYKSSLKMVAPLLNCTVVEEQAVIHFLGSEC
jgi:hypothetical protein